jgi:phage regulator Rha-like protein
MRNKLIANSKIVANSANVPHSTVIEKIEELIKEGYEPLKNAAFIEEKDASGNTIKVYEFDSNTAGDLLWIVMLENM